MSKFRKIGLDMAESKGKSYFLGIGINEYLHFTPLVNAVDDVKDVLHTLQEAYDIDEAFLLFNSDATRKNIIKQLDKLSRLVKPEDKLIIYYSGHGHYQQSKGYWIPYDAEKDNRAEYLPNSRIKDYLDEIDSKHSLLISDACFSGSLFVRGGTRSVASAEELEKRRSRWAICSGRQDEEVYDGDPGENSPFAASIIQILRRNTAPKLTVGMLGEEVKEMTIAKYRQLPMSGRLFDVAGDEGGEYVFHRQRAIAEDRPEIPSEYPSTPTPKMEVKNARKIPRKRILTIGLVLVMTMVAVYLFKDNWKTEVPEGPTISNTPPTVSINDVILRDKRDGREYNTVTVNGVAWMAENLDYETSGSWCYDDDPANCNRYGRLYTLATAKTACPEGWRLPTGDEWEALLTAFGGYFANGPGEIGYPERAFLALIEGGKSGFNAQFGGFRYLDGEDQTVTFDALNDYGYYWSSTDYKVGNSNYLKTYAFSKRNNFVIGDSDSLETGILFGFSCRCVKD